ncbi:MAG: ABC transporter substrate-binding protein [Fermentimonas sp.]|jgi:ABC-type Fe3+-hydroxamate transport system substrate-binding protein
MVRKSILFLFINTIAATAMLQGQPYTRIVSLAPSFTKSIDHLGAWDNLVGRTSFCQANDSEKVEVVASAVKANIEKIISLKPDVVLASGLTHPKDIELLRKVGIKVEIIYSPKSFEELCDQFIQMGEWTGKSEKARAIVNECRQTVEKLTRENGSRPSKKVFFQVGANPIFSVVPNTYMDDFITLLGAKNIAVQLTGGTVTREFVIANNPDYIFIATMGIEAEKEVQTWKKYTSLTATRKGNIHIIDADKACQPIPSYFAETLQEINRLMQEVEK